MTYAMRNEEFRRSKMLFQRAEEFAEAVKRSKGKIVFLVHPSYSGVVQMRKLVQKTKVPLVVLEVDFKIDETKDRLRTEKSFFVSTEYADPTPLGGWTKLHEVLRASNVKTILVGGALSSPVPEETVKIFYPEVHAHEKNLGRRLITSIVRGCVGATYVELIKAGHPKVRLMPGLLHEHKPQYARRV